jgi:hypothetical protein
LCEVLLHRKPYKLIKEIENDVLLEYNTQRKIESFFKKEQKEYEYYFMEDVYSNIAYKDTYLLGKRTAEDAAHIWLKSSDNNLKEFAEVSPIVKSLRNNELKKRRGYVHRDYCEQIKEIIKK